MIDNINDLRLIIKRKKTTKSNSSAAMFFRYIDDIASGYFVDHVNFNLIVDKICEIAKELPDLRATEEDIREELTKKYSYPIFSSILRMLGFDGHGIYTSSTFIKNCRSATHSNKFYVSRLSNGKRKHRTVPNCYRLIWDTINPTIKERQKYWARRVGSIRPHFQSWGFAKNRSCIGACKAHFRYWNVNSPGQLSFLSMDIENFFSSITGDMIVESMMKHEFSDSEIQECLDNCTITIDANILAWIFQILNNEGYVVSNRLRVRWLKEEVLPRLFTRDARISTAEDLLNLSNRYIEFINQNSGQNQVGAMINSVLYSHIEPARDFLKIRRGLDESMPFMEIEANPAMIGVLRKVILSYMLGFPDHLCMGDRVLIQGASSSPAISNIVGKKMDVRLAALAQRFDCYYTRYADDITFSWKERKTKKEINIIKYYIKQITTDCGFGINTKKTVIKGPGMRQALLGYNMNSGAPTVSRARRNKVIGFLNHYSKSGNLREDNVEISLVQSILGEVEFIASAHPELGEELRKKGRDVMDKFKYFPPRPIDFESFDSPVNDCEEVRTKSEICLED